MLLGSRSSEIAESPCLLAELRDALLSLRREATQPATAAEVVAILAPRFAIYPQPDRTGGEWDAWWAEYTHALDDTPPAAIEAGMAEYVKAPDSEFFPKPGKIRDLARTTPSKLATAVLTGQWALRRAEESAREYVTEAPKVPVPKESVREMLAGFHKAMAERAPAPKPTLPPISGPVDGSGVTQAMREQMRRNPR